MVCASYFPTRNWNFFSQFTLKTKHHIEDWATFQYTWLNYFEWIPYGSRCNEQWQAIQWNRQMFASVKLRCRTHKNTSDFKKRPLNVGSWVLRLAGCCGDSLSCKRTKKTLWWKKMSIANDEVHTIKWDIWFNIFALFHCMHRTMSSYTVALTLRCFEVWTIFFPATYFDKFHWAT